MPAIMGRRSLSSFILGLVLGVLAMGFMINSTLSGRTQAQAPLLDAAATSKQVESESAANQMKLAFAAEKKELQSALAEAKSSLATIEAAQGVRSSSSSSASSCAGPRQIDSDRTAYSTAPAASYLEEVWGLPSPPSIVPTHLDGGNQARVLVCATTTPKSMAALHSTMAHLMFGQGLQTVLASPKANGKTAAHDLSLCWKGSLEADVNARKAFKSRVDQGGAGLVQPWLGLGSTVQDGIFYAGGIKALVPLSLSNGTTRPLLVSYHMEAYNTGQLQKYDFMFTCRRPAAMEGLYYHLPYAYMPPAFWKMARRDLANVGSLLRPDDFDAKAQMNLKTMFAAFLVKTCWHEVYQNNYIMVRAIFFDLLSEYKQVTPLGGCRGNATKYGTSKVKLADLDGPANAFRPFKFSITFENNVASGYTTEKIMNGLLANTVPIYWGDPDVHLLLNPDRFVWCNVTAEQLKPMMTPKVRSKEEAEIAIKRAARELGHLFKPCIAEVIHLDTDEAAYQAKLDQPILRDNRVEGSYFDLRRYANNMRTVLQHYESPLGQSASRLELGPNTTV